jgi:small subunit ribosomal protein S8
MADMLTRIRNATMARHDYVLVPGSQLKVAVAKILKEEGFIKDFELQRDGVRRMLKIWLSYTGKKEPILSGLKRVSKPGLRVYAGSKQMPKVVGGMGVAIVSTPRGVMTAEQARRLNVGGEVLCYIW